MLYCNIAFVWLGVRHVVGVCVRPWETEVSKLYSNFINSLLVEWTLSCLCLWCALGCHISQSCELLRFFTLGKAISIYTLSRTNAFIKKVSGAGAVFYCKWEVEFCVMAPDMPSWNNQCLPHWYSSLTESDFMFSVGGFMTWQMCISLLCKVRWMWSQRIRLSKLLKMHWILSPSAKLMRKSFSPSAAAVYSQSREISWTPNQLINHSVSQWTGPHIAPLWIKSLLTMPEMRSRYIADANTPERNALILLAKHTHFFFFF